MVNRGMEERRSYIIARDESYWSNLIQEDDPGSALAVVYEGPRGATLVLDEVRSAGRVPVRRPLGEEEQRAWLDLEESLHEATVLTVRVVGYNRGGLLVRVLDLQGFVPSSQIEDLPRQLDDEGRAERMATYVGSELQCRVIELDQERNRVILSERAATPDGLQGEHLLDVLHEGAIVEGRVSNVCTFGVFVDLGGLEGLVHISELSWRRVLDPHEVSTLGESVRAFVLSVSKEKRRVALSFKRLQPDPWEGIEERYRVGESIDAVVTNVVDFGAFASVGDGVEGLVHVSEMDLPPGEVMQDVVQEGDTIRVHVLHIDRESRRLGLGLRGA